MVIPLLRPSGDGDPAIVGIGERRRRLRSSRPLTRWEVLTGHDSPPGPCGCRRRFVDSSRLGPSGPPAAAPERAGPALLAGTRRVLREQADHRVVERVLLFLTGRGPVDRVAGHPSPHEPVGARIHEVHDERSHPHVLDGRGADPASPAAPPPAAEGRDLLLARDPTANRDLQIELCRVPAAAPCPAGPV